MTDHNPLLPDGYTVARYNGLVGRVEPVRVELEAHGYRYVVYVTPLPVAADGGDPDTHALVTVLHPHGSDAWVFSRDGDLNPHYVAEKMRTVPDGHTRDVDAIGHAIGIALGRTYNSPY